MEFPGITLSSAAAVVCVLLAALVVMYDKLSSAIARQGQQARAIADNVFGQIEALMALQTELKFEHALPPTRSWAASPDFLRNVMLHARGQRPSTVVECSSGVSTLVLAQCMKLNGCGHVYCLEHDPVYAEKTRNLLKLHGLDAYASILDAPLQDLRLEGWQGKWYTHEVLPQDMRIDLVVIDGPPWFSSPLARYPAIPVLKPRMAIGAAVFLDDADREEERQSVARWRQANPDLIELSVPPCEKGCVALQRHA